jgi:hypothetical protein
MCQEPVTPSCTGLAVVQVGNALDFAALWTDISRGAASSFAYSDGEPAVNLTIKVRKLSVS